jgi:hypothetical protein
MQPPGNPALGGAEQHDDGEVDGLTSNTVTRSMGARHGDCSSLKRLNPLGLKYDTITSRGVIGSNTDGYQ